MNKFGSKKNSFSGIFDVVDKIIKIIDPMIKIDEESML